MNEILRVTKLVVGNLLQNPTRLLSLRKNAAPGAKVFL